MMTLNDFTILQTDTIYNAIVKIDKNKNGFILIIDEEDRLVATLTDGDIRRTILKKIDIENSVISISNKDFTSISYNSSFEKIANLFKKESIKFLPVVDDNDMLINVLTKKQFHLLILENKKVDLLGNLFELDNEEHDDEVNVRPWGFYKSMSLTPYSQSKIIHIFPQQELSLQEHKKREEHWIIAKGEGEVTLGESVKNVHEGMYVFVPKGCKHKIKNVTKNNNLILLEVQLGNYFGEDDIIRYEDKYGRV